MQKKKSNNTLLTRLLLFILLFGAAGYFREYFFVQINNILYMKFYNTTSTLPVGTVMKSFEQLNYNTLYYLKYPFTIVWTGIFFYLNLRCIKTFDPWSQNATRSLIYSYGIALGISAASMTFSFVLNGAWERDEYTLSRWLFGLVQSPIPALILLAAGTLQKQQEKKI